MRVFPLEILTADVNTLRGTEAQALRSFVDTFSEEKTVIIKPTNKVLERAKVAKRKTTSIKTPSRKGWMKDIMFKEKQVRQKRSSKTLQRTDDL